MPVPAKDDLMPAVAQGLTGRINTQYTLRQIAPSRHNLITQSGHTDADGRARGIAIHLMLDHLTRSSRVGTDMLLQQVAGLLERNMEDHDLQAWWTEACTLLQQPSLAALFDSACCQQAWNEVPVQYLEQGTLVHGVIDRLVLSGDAVLLIDYKTHRQATTRTIPQLVESYRTQMAYYTRAITRLWPHRTVRSGLLFTACAELVWLDGLQSLAEPEKPRVITENE
jgi:ATP-dependent helicase/nuclease subunit A